MKSTLRGIVATALLFVLAQTGLAQGQPAAGSKDKTVLATERDKDSYMVGIDVAHSIAAAAPDMDYAAFERARCATVSPAASRCWTRRKRRPPDAR